MKKIIAVMFLILAFTGVAEAGPTCKGLVGTWNVNYSIGSSPSDVTFAITSSGASGAVYGAYIGAYGPPMKGYCKNGIVNLSITASDSATVSIFFANEQNGFAKYIFTTGPSTYAPKEFNVYWYPALVTKTSSAIAKNYDKSIDIDSANQQIIEEIDRHKTDQR